MEPEAWQQAIARDLFTAHLRDQQELTVRINAILRSAAKESEQILIKLEKVDGVGATIRAAQYAQSMLALRQVQRELWNGVTGVTQNSIDKAVSAAANGSILLERVLLSAVGSTDLRDSMIAAARHSVFNIRSRILNEIRFSGLVYKNETLATGKVAEAVNRGIALNKSAKEIADSVRSFIRPDVPGGASYAALRLGRTELNNAFHHTTVDSAASLPWTEGVKWNLSKSHPAPDPCDDIADADSDGLGKGVYLSTNVPDKPHPQCFCYVTVVTVGKEEFKRKLFDGDYDGWLVGQGLTPIRLSKLMNTARNLS